MPGTVEMYITDRAGGRLRIPLPPDEISVKVGANIITASIIKLGEVKIPRGTILTAYSWNGVLPGEHMKAMSYVQEWQEPQRIAERLREYCATGETITLVVTGAGINADVFIESFVYSPRGGMGDIHYSIAMTARRKLTITTVPAEYMPPGTVGGTGEGKYGIVTMNKKKGKLTIREKAAAKSKKLGTVANGETVEVLEAEGAYYKILYDEIEGYVDKIWVLLTGDTSASMAAQTLIVPEHPQTYIVKSGDTLYTIAKQQLGNGGRYIEIYNLNKKAIAAANKKQKVNRYNVDPGMTLQLP